MCVTVEGRARFGKELDELYTDGPGGVGHGGPSAKMATDDDDDDDDAE